MQAPDLNDRIRDLTGQPGSRYKVPTPALIVDVDALGRNVAKMAQRSREAGVSLRPHAKTHKSAYVARLQLEAGAIGVCCAKLGEAEALMSAGVRGVLTTSPIAGGDCAARAVALARVDPTFALVVDHPAQTTALAAAMSGRERMRVLIDVDVGLKRTGVDSAAAALELARAIRATATLALVGVQGYGGHWQHMKGLDGRREAVAQGMRRLSEVIGALRAAGCTIDLVTGGGTGTFAADAALQVFNELQPGSYVFMDRQYREALEGDADGDFEQSLFVQARVISANWPTHVTVDAGLKAFATDGPLPRPSGARFAGSEYSWFGDEHGRLTRPPQQSQVELDERVELIAPHCDPTVDRHRQYVLVRGDTVIGVAPIEAAQRSQ
jgi:D-serine deaminase-like pyridoxal phosphate-dependent protein